MIPATPNGNSNFTLDTMNVQVVGDAEEVRLLPDDSWIAIVCGATKEQWLSLDDDEDSDLPHSFYVAPKDVYMPDLTAIGDVLLGKLVSYDTLDLIVISAYPAIRPGLWHCIRVR
jgi:hypothetical protein